MNFDASLSAATYLQAAEDVRRRVFMTANTSRFSAPTLVFTPWDLFGYEFRQLMSTPEEAERAADAIASAARDVVVPFLNAHLGLNEVEALANDVSAPGYRPPRSEHDAYSRLILAKLADQRSLDGVADRLRDELADYGPWVKKAFAELYAYLTAGELPARLQGPTPGR